MLRPLVATRVVALTLVTAAGRVAAVHVTHPRDGAAFVDYLQSYGNSLAAGGPYQLPPTEQPVSEGDRAKSD